MTPMEVNLSHRPGPAPPPLSGPFTVTRTGGALPIPNAAGEPLCWRLPALSRIGQRNAPTILNALCSKTQFWDGRAKTLEQQAALPIVNPFEWMR